MSRLLGLEAPPRPYLAVSACLTSSVDCTQECTMAVHSFRVSSEEAGLVGLEPARKGGPGKLDRTSSLADGTIGSTDLSTNSSATTDRC